MSLFFSQSAHTQIKVQSFDSRDGLCQSHVFCICEDSLGYLWFGTYDGVSRWDGVNFTNYQTLDGLPSAGVRTIYQGLDGRLYFGTTRGVCFLERSFFQALRTDTLLMQADISALFQTCDSTLYIGTTDQGLWVYHRGTATPYPLGNTVENLNITGVEQTPSGKLLASSNRGVFDLSDNGKSISELQGQHITCVCECADGALYFGTYLHGIHIFQNGVWRKFDVADGLSDNRVRKIRQRSDGKIFIATFGGGLTILDRQRIETLTEKNGLASNSMFTIQIGPEGSVYLGTHGGISVVKRYEIESYSQESGLSKNYIVAVAAGEDGTLFAGTFGGGLSILRQGQWRTITTQDGMASNHVFAILPIKDSVFLGTFGGVSIFDGSTIRNLTMRDGLLHPLVRAIVSGAHGDIYFGSELGVNLWHDGAMSTVCRTTGSVNALCYDREGILWIGTDEGLHTFRDRESYRLADTIPVDSLEIYAIFQSRDGAHYFGTDHGLYIRRDGEWHFLSPLQGLSHSKIEGIAEDDNGRIYLTSLRGVTVLADDRVIRVLRHSDGLCSEEISPNAVCRDNGGSLWFGTIRGLTRYRPQFDQPDPEPAKVHFERIRIAEQDLPLDKLEPTGHVVKFRHDQNYIKFDYIGIYLPAPRKVRYQIMLQGLDQDWIETEQTFMQYTNLNDGKYAFQVRAVNEWGVWSEPAVMRFSIAPPFWERWWFILGAILVAGTLTGYLVHLRIQSLLALERLRSKIAADLHDNMGASLTEISILSEVSARSLQDEIQVKRNLQKIGDTARSLIDGMSDIVWLVNPKQDSLYDLMLRLKDVFNDMFVSKGITFRTNDLHFLEQVHLPMEYRQQLFLLFKEAIHNSIKHSECTEIQLQAALQDKMLEMTLTDNGSGWSRTNESNGNGHGLDNMQRRARAIGGQLGIVAQKNLGTTISFSGVIR